MSRPSSPGTGVESLGRQAMATIRGESCADDLLRRMRAGAADPNALTDEVRRLVPEPTALSGFLRRVQKALEGRAVS